MLVNEVLSRPMRDRRAVARYAGLTGAPDESGAKRREKGLAKAGNARVRRGMIPLAWRFLRFQKDSALARWYPHGRSPCRHAQDNDCRPRAQTARRTLALCHHGRDARGRRLTSSGLKGVYQSITTELFGSRAGFSAHRRIDDPRWREAAIRTGSDADRKIGPAARSFAADAHDCIMVRTSTNLPNTSLRREIRLNRKLLSDLIVPPRAPASRRCETQPTLGGKPPSSASVSVP